MAAHHNVSTHQFGIPPEFGTTPIPEGMVRFNHYTSTPEVGQSIKQTGLLRSKGEESFARGTTESPEVFATAGAPTDSLKHGSVYVEGYADATRGGQLNIGENWRGDPPAEHAERLEKGRQTITARGDIPAQQILHVHEPWHETFRYLANEPSMERGVVGGDYDTHSWANPDHTTQRAVDATKTMLAAKVMLGGKLQGKSYADEGIPTERNPTPKKRT